MTAAAPQEQPLSADLIPAIFQPDLSMAVMKVQAFHSVRQLDGDQQIEVGPLVLLVSNVIHGDLHTDQVVEVRANRVADPLVRPRQGFNAWNTFPLVPNGLLIMAIRPANPWNAIAAQMIASPNAPEISALRHAYAIQNLPGNVAANAAALTDALRSKQHILLFFALEYLRRHTSSEWPAATNVLAQAVTSAQPSDQTLEMGRFLAKDEFFRPSEKTNSVNGTVIASLCHALVQETDPTRRASWAQLVLSCLFNDFTNDQQQDHQIRSALAHSPGVPPAKNVIAAISAAEHSVEPDARPDLEQLKHLWQTP